MITGDSLCVSASGALLVPCSVGVPELTTDLFQLDPKQSIRKQLDGFLKIGGWSRSDHGSKEMMPLYRAAAYGPIGITRVGATKQTSMIICFFVSRVSTNYCVTILIDFTRIVCQGNWIEKRPLKYFLIGQPGKQLSTLQRSVVVPTGSSVK